MMDFVITLTFLNLSPEFHQTSNLHEARGVGLRLALLTLFTLTLTQADTGNQRETDSVKVMVTTDQAITGSVLRSSSTQPQPERSQSNVLTRNPVLAA